MIKSWTAAKSNWNQINTGRSETLLHLLFLKNYLREYDEYAVESLYLKQWYNAAIWRLRQYLKFSVLIANFQKLKSI